MNIDQMPAGREMDLLIINTIPDLMPKPWKSGNSTINHKIERLKDGPIDVFDGGGSKVEAEDGEPYIVWVRDDGYKGIKKLVPRYSTNIADAWEVVEKITSKQCGDADDFYVFKIIKRYQQWSVYIHHPLWNGRYNELSPIYEMHEAVADTAPLAIFAQKLGGR